MRRSLGVSVLPLAFAACATSPDIPHSAPPALGGGYPERLEIAEPDALEIVVVINDNVRMQHAGMFAGATLLDPAGSYRSVRSREPDWTGSSLRDYVRFQLEDGPEVRLYRFTLPAARFAQIKMRVDEAGGTVPLFCAAKVQNILSGIAPFESLPTTWLISPVRLSRHLDAIVGPLRLSGACQWPTGASCYSPVPSTAIETAAR
ncbi:MAG: hypothetical protein QM739_10125 [Propionivibrio sp.]